MTAISSDSLILREPKRDETSAGALSLFPEYEPHEKNGVVYTKSWVAELILDLAGYCADRDLAQLRAVEPAAGDGAFLLPMIRRLAASCQKHARRLAECGHAILAYELDEFSAKRARCATTKILREENISAQDANLLTDQWIRTGDYLLEADTLLPVDFVIGNPPYVRLEEINPAVTCLYREKYQTMVGR
jgi:type I restriction-modification system DNA methylase subunit